MLIYIFFHSLKDLDQKKKKNQYTSLALGLPENSKP